MGRKYGGCGGGKKCIGFWDNCFKKLLTIPSLAAKGVTELVGERQEEGQSTMFGHDRLAKHFCRCASTD